MGFKDTLVVLNALVDKIEALEWTPVEGVPEAAFEKVSLYDLSELETALQELLVFKGRVCFVILDAEDFSSELMGGPKLLVRQVRRVALLISDRDFGKRQNALTGSRTAPGVLVLKDLVLNGEAGKPEKGVVGALTVTPDEEIPNPPRLAVVVPTTGQFVTLSGKDREDLAGRLCWELDLELRGGSFEANVGRAPVL